MLKCNWEELKNITLKIEKYYWKKTNIKYDSNGQPKVDLEGNIRLRVLYPSRGVLKEIQSKLKKSVFDKIPLPIHIQGGVKRRSNITNAILHKGNKYFFVTDIENFFPSISHRKVYNTLIQEGFSYDVASIITKLTTFRGQLPQGTPTSTAISNLVFQKTDENIIKICNSFNLIYSRFVDDVTISGKADFQELSSQIVQVILQNGFSISKNKTAYKVGKTDVTGILVSNNKIETTAKFENKLLNRQSPETLNGRKNYRSRVKNMNRRSRKSIISNI